MLMSKDFAATKSPEAKETRPKTTLNWGDEQHSKEPRPSETELQPMTMTMTLVEWAQ